MRTFPLNPQRRQITLANLLKNLNWSLLPKPDDITDEQANTYFDSLDKPYPNIKAEVLAISRYPQSDVMVSTVRATIPRIILAQVNKHRSETNNAASSRAIPNKKMRQSLEKAWYIPPEFGTNQPGMAAGPNLLGWKHKAATLLWISAAWWMVIVSTLLAKLGVHKQWANRLLEPFLYVNVILTSKDWTNFLNLRIDPASQPEIQVLASKILQAHLHFDPTKVRTLSYDRTQPSGWHNPMIALDGVENKGVDSPLEMVLVLKQGASRLARTSYLTEESVVRTRKEELKTADKLVEGRHVHGTPFEHIMCVAREGDLPQGSTAPFKTLRHIIEDAKLDSKSPMKPLWGKVAIRLVPSTEFNN